MVDAVSHATGGGGTHLSHNEYVPSFMTHPIEVGEDSYEALYQGQSDGALAHPGFLKQTGQFIQNLPHTAWQQVKTIIVDVISLPKIMWQHFWDSLTGQHGKPHPHGAHEESHHNPWVNFQRPKLLGKNPFLAERGIFSGDLRDDTIGRMNY